MKQLTATQPHPFVVPRATSHHAPRPPAHTWPSPPQRRPWARAARPATPAVPRLRRSSLRPARRASFDGRQRAGGDGSAGQWLCCRHAACAAPTQLSTARAARGHAGTRSALQRRQHAARRPAWSLCPRGCAPPPPPPRALSCARERRARTDRPPARARLPRPSSALSGGLSCAARAPPVQRQRGGRWECQARRAARQHAAQLARASCPPSSAHTLEGARARQRACGCVHWGSHPAGRWPGAGRCSVSVLSRPAARKGTTRGASRGAARRGAARCPNPPAPPRDGA